MNAYMDMDKGVVGFTKVDGHCFSSLFALRSREIELLPGVFGYLGRGKEIVNDGCGDELS